MNDRIFVFDNGSVASKLLQYENKDAEVIKVSGTDLVQQFTKFDNNKGRKIYLPFTVEQLAANNEQLRREIQKVESLGFKNLIVLPYEGRDEQTIRQKAKEAGIIKTLKPGESVQLNEKKEPSNASRSNQAV